jgi:CelD/BcsL family acetyltransferase involved in cellulose biosynthesis
VFYFDPIHDPRWLAFLQQHPAATVFHSPAWLNALKKTFGYEPFVATTAVPDEALRNGLVFCRISSPLTGRRFVSLPFSDHCEPLTERPEDLPEIMRAMAHYMKREGMSYTEVRPRTSGFPMPAGFAPANEFWLHALDLTPSVDELFRALHKDCIQRKVRRAEREGLVAEAGRTDGLLRTFYQMLLVTRRRLGVPPHPFLWFQNLVQTFGEDLEISVATKDGQPVAGILTLRFKDALVYKYGCSDTRHNRLGGMPFLFWRAIRQAKSLGLREFDFGRSDLADTGLIAFKDRWGCTRTPLKYWRSPAASSALGRHRRILRAARPLVACIPLPLLSAVGKLVTRHLG